MFDLTINLDNESKLPLYEQLYRAIAEQIQNGHLLAGEKLPSKRFLCEQFGISHSTVETAYGFLVAEGYVQAEPRIGYRVCEVVPLQSINERKDVKEDNSPAKKEHSYLRFSTGDVDTEIFPYASWAKIYKEVIYQEPELLQKGDPQGDLSFRETLRAFLEEYRGVHCKPEQIIVGAGVEYLLDLVLQLFPEEEKIALEDPGYDTAYRVAKNNGKTAIPVPVDAHGMELEPLYESKAHLAYVTPSHQFPMGFTMPMSRRTHLLQWANEQNGYIIEDDYDSEFRYRLRPIPAMQGLDREGRVIYIGTFSRTLAPSIRAAYMVLPETLLPLWQEHFGWQASTISRFEQHALERFIRQGLYARHLRRLGPVYKGRMIMLKEALKGLQDAYISGEEAGMHFLLHLPQMEEASLIKEAADQGLMLTPLSQYCHEVSYEGTVLVLGFAGLTQETCKTAVQILKNICH